MRLFDRLLAPWRPPAPTPQTVLIARALSSIGQVLTLHHQMLGFHAITLGKAAEAITELSRAVTAEPSLKNPWDAAAVSHVESELEQLTSATLEDIRELERMVGLEAPEKT